MGSVCLPRNGFLGSSHAEQYAGTFTAVMTIANLWGYVTLGVMGQMAVHPWAYLSCLLASIH
eukprot:7000626-Karenia_brevis.AAC.1